MLADVRPALSRFAPTAASAATGVQVGAAIVATRFVIGQTSPASLALLRYAIGFCCLLPAAARAARTARAAGATGSIAHRAPRDRPVRCRGGAVEFCVAAHLLDAHRADLRDLP